METRTARRAFATIGAFALVLSIGVGSVAAAGPGGGARRGGGTPVTPPPTTAVILTAAQKTALAGMAEEEKLARDLYTAFAARYGTRVFATIGRAESTHLAAIRTLLARYGIADPTAGRAAGSFASADMAAMYTKLLADGKVSLAAAYGVGKAVELDDIAELDQALAGLTASDVRQAYTNLRRGSTQHLAAFNRLLGN
jgi:hypothetical protein